MPRARRVQAERVQTTCPSAGSIGGAHLENQDQASRCLNGAAAADDQVLQQRSSGSSTRQVQGMPAGSPSCRFLKVKMGAAAGLGEAPVSGDRG